MSNAKPRKSDSSKKTGTVNRVMVKLQGDDFYNHDYEVLQKEALNKFDPIKNSNKFYMIELHQGSQGGFRVYINYGRVGVKGTENARPFNDHVTSEKFFKKQVASKVKSGYIKLDVAVASRGSEKAQTQVDVNALGNNVQVKTKASTTLPLKIAKLVKHLYEEANQAVSLSVTGSAKSSIEAPIGNLGIQGINNGRSILNGVSQALKIGDTHRLRLLSIEYYRNIPRKLPGDLRDEANWILNTQHRIAKELDVLDLYEDTLRLLPVMGSSDLDSKFMALNTDIRFVDDPETVAYIQHKVASTHAPNHNYKLKVVNAFEVNMRNAPLFNEGVGNVRKLFHGSRSANLVGILSSYLKLPSQLSADVHKTGAMFGPGVYFASDVTKSANYSAGYWSGKPNKHDTFFIMICDVALGNVHQVTAPKNFRQPPQGYHSVMGAKGPHLYNNEFIVYSPDQVKVRYLVEVAKA